MANDLNSLLASNSEINQYFSSLPSNVQNACTGNGSDICSLEDLLEYIKKLTGSTCG